MLLVISRGRPSRWTCLLALVLSQAAFLGCQSDVVEPDPVRPVRSIKLADWESFQARWFPGRAEPVDEVDLSFRVSGPLIALPVRVGSVVQTNELLAAIDPTDYRIALDRAKANVQRAEAEMLVMQRGARPEEIAQLKAGLAEVEAGSTQASAEHERNIGLRKQGALSQAEFDLSLARRDRAAAQVAVAQESLRIGEQGAREEDQMAKRAEIGALTAAVRDAENRLSFTSLFAPFDSEVAARYVDNFQTIQAQQPVLRLFSTTEVKIVVQVPEGAISYADQVESMICRFDAFPDRSFTGEVFEIGRQASRTTRTFPVTVLVKQTEGATILPGMAASVQPVLKESAAIERQNLTLPVAAVFTPETAEQSCVWVVDEAGGTVSRREVKLGQLTLLGIVVISGVEPGDRVVTAGVHSLREGQQVRWAGGDDASIRGDQ